ncbi:MAG: hypothetical protein KAR40_15590 [Candidatus Sabulitectum sp.]|nr:hypothetical protein [Candidatus Sabulitectum sp.]
MRIEFRIAAVFAALIFSISCGADPAASDQPNETIIPHYELTVTGTYCVEIGDSINMIGSIADLCYHPDGSILILDRAAMLVRRIHDGDVTFISRAGEGPGEMIFPQSICCMPGGK